MLAAGVASAEELTPALEALGVTAESLRLPVDTVPRDRFRLDVVDEALADPVRTHALAEDLIRMLDDPRLEGVFRSFRDGLSAGPGLGEAPPRAGIADVVATSLELEGAPASERAWLARIAEAVDASVSRLRLLDPRVCEAAVSELREEEDVEALDPFQLRNAERASLEASDAFYASIEAVDVQGLARALEPLLALADALRSDPPGSVDGWVPLRIDTALGAVWVGTPGADRYPGDACVILDPGGDDDYRRGAAGTGVGSRPVSVVIDLAGDDVYGSSEDAGVAAAVGGVALLLDRSGDDTYRTGGIGLGAAVLGAAALIDVAGDDVYDGDRFGQGAGFLGMGLLLDEAGSDVYRLASYGQGFGGVGGIGVLHDRAGGDRYVYAPRYTDVIRYEDHHVTFLQGAALGGRPDHSGGIGLLRDDDGHDLYHADIYGQGTAYWFGFGILYDAAGHDTYVAYQYAQGAGIHLAPAVLWDAAGNDVYRAKGVSQGCGHDLAVGWLRDDRGNDTYVCSELSQGAGNANGVGILEDVAGGDGYLGRDDVTTLGYGNPRRGSGSAGVFLDYGGRDVYAQDHADGSVWWGSTFGTGLDAPSDPGAADPWTEEVTATLPDVPRSDEELFVLATTAPPKFARLREAALAELADERGTEAMPTLLGHMRTRIPRERHGLKDIFARMGGSAVPFLATVLDTGGVRARRLAAWSLGYIPDAAGVPVLLAHASDPDAGVRADVGLSVGQVVRGDSTVARGGLALALLPLTRDESASVRRSAASSLSALTGERAAIDALVSLLGDPAYTVVAAAAEGLVRHGEASVAGLRAAWSDTAPRSWMLQVLGRLASDGHVTGGDARWLRGLADSLAPERADVATRLHYARALRALSGATPELSALRQDPDWRVVEAAGGR